MDIVKDRLRVLEENEHIGMMSLSRIDEAQRHRDQIGSGSIEMWANIHSGMGGIPAGQFNHLDLTLEIEIWFSLLQRKLLQPNHFSSRQELERAMLDFMTHYNQTAKPLK